MPDFSQFDSKEKKALKSRGFQKFQLQRTKEITDDNRACWGREFHDSKVWQGGGGKSILHVASGPPRKTGTDGQIFPQIFG